MSIEKSIENPYLIPEGIDLVKKEQAAWKSRLGNKIEVPEPPIELFNTLKKAEQIGWKIFDPHYIPNNRNEFYPYLKENWILIDRTEIPYLNETNTQMFYDKCKRDPVGKLIDELQMEGKIITPLLNRRYSRISIGLYDIENKLFPAIKKLLNLNTDINVRLPTIGEYNELCNLFYHEWTDTDLSEWFDDKVDLGGDFSYRLKGCPSRQGPEYGVSKDNLEFKDRSRLDIYFTFFRPAIVFPTKNNA